MTLGLLLSPGDSLSKQDQSGQLDRFIKYYLVPYSKQFNQVYIFTHGNDINQITKLPANIKVISKPSFIPYQVYQLLIPLIHRKIIKQTDLFRVFQAIGGLPLLFIDKPFVITYGYHYAQFAKIENQPIKAKLINLIIKPVLKKATKIIVTTLESKNYLSEYSDKLILIPNGVDVDIFKPNYPHQNLHLVLTIGRLTEQKNQALIIKTIAASHFRDKLRLLIIGQGNFKLQLIQLAKHLNVNLKIIDQLPHHQLVKYYQQAGIFMLTSKIEGHPKALLEAMSSGCPCLTTSFSGNSIKANHNGIIARAQTDLVKKLDRLLIHPNLKRKLGQNARQEIIKNFNITKLIKKEIALLKTLTT